MLAAPIQTTLDVAIPLDQVTFCVVDLETTGGSPADAASPRSERSSTAGGERSARSRRWWILRSHPAVHHTADGDRRPGRLREPPIEEILPAFLEFCRGAVFVAHNARFDFSFLNANLTAPRLRPVARAGRVHGQARAARRLARRPERQAADLVAVLPHASHAQPPGLGRRRGLRRGAPRAARPGRAARDPDARRPARGGARPGAAQLRQDRAGRPPAARSRRVPVPRSRRQCAVRRQVEGPAGPGEVVLLRRRAQEGRRPLAQTTSIDGETLRVGARGARRRGAVDPPARAEVQPARQDLATLRVPQGRPRRGVPPAEGRPSRRRPATDAPTSVRSTRPRPPVSPKRRSRRSPRSADAPAMRARTRFAPCALADMGRCVAPCDGRIDPERYGELVRRLVSSLTSPGGLLEALERRMAHLADRNASRRPAWCATGSARWPTPGAAAEATRGSWARDAHGPRRRRRRRSGSSAGAMVAAGTSSRSAPVPRERADELAAVRSWFRANHPRVEACGRPLAEPVDGGAASPASRSASEPPGRAGRRLDATGRGP